MEVRVSKFQSQTGFFAASDGNGRAPAPPSPGGFNPRRASSLLLTLLLPRPQKWKSKFQSQTGFFAASDPPFLQEGGWRNGSVSIPDGLLRCF